MPLKVLGLKVQSSGFRGSRFKVQGSEVQGSRFRVQRFKVQGSGFRVQGYRIQTIKKPTARRQIQYILTFQQDSDE